MERTGNGGVWNVSHGDDIERMGAARGGLSAFVDASVSVRTLSVPLVSRKPSVNSVT